jgi:hypothetical protein
MEKGAGDMKRTFAVVLIVLSMLAVVAVTASAGGADKGLLSPQAVKHRFDWIVANKMTILQEVDFKSDQSIDGNLTVVGTSDLQGNVSDSGGTFTVADLAMIDGAEDGVQLTVQGYSTQTSDSFVVEDSAGTDDFVVGGTGITTISAERDAASSYDYYLTVEGDYTGVASGAKTYGLYVSGSRPATADNTGGDCDDAGVKIRIDNDADGNYYGYVMRGLDVQAKNDNSGDAGIHNHVTTLSGASITAQSDSGTGEPYTVDAYGLQVNVTANGRVTNTLVSGDFRLFRQAATEPASEYVVRVRNGNTSGTGVDAGIYFKSDYSGDADDFDYVIDMSAADADDADIRLTNGETIDNITDGEVAFSGAVIGVAGNFTPTYGSMLTPTLNAYYVHSSAAVSMTLGSGCTAGHVVYLYGDDANNVTVNDTNIRTTDGNAVVFDQYDSVGWLCMSDEWNLMFESNNQ